MDCCTVDAELELLRDFYVKWRNLHEIAKTKNRRSMEMASQRLVDSAQAVANFDLYHAEEAGHA